MEDFYDIKTSKIDGQTVCLFGIFDGKIFSYHSCLREIQQFVGNHCLAHTQGVLCGSMLKDEYKLLHWSYRLNVFPYARYQRGKLLTLCVLPFLT